MKYRVSLAVLMCLVVLAMAVRVPKAKKKSLIEVESKKSEDIETPMIQNAEESKTDGRAKKSTSMTFCVEIRPRSNKGPVKVCKKLPSQHQAGQQIVVRLIEGDGCDQQYNPVSQQPQQLQKPSERLIEDEDDVQNNFDRFYYPVEYGRVGSYYYGLQLFPAGHGGSVGDYGPRHPFVSGAGPVGHYGPSRPVVPSGPVGHYDFIDPVTTGGSVGFYGRNGPFYYRPNGPVVFYGSAGFNGQYNSVGTNGQYIIVGPNGPADPNGPRANVGPFGPHGHLNANNLFRPIYSSPLIFASQTPSRPIDCPPCPTTDENPEFFDAILGTPLNRIDSENATTQTQDDKEPNPTTESSSPTIGPNTTDASVYPTRMFLYPRVG